MGNAHWTSSCCSACTLITAQVSLILETPCLLHICVGQIIGTLHIWLGSFLGKLLVFRPFCIIVLESLLVSNLLLCLLVSSSQVGCNAESTYRKASMVVQLVNNPPAMQWSLTVIDGSNWGALRKLIMKINWPNVNKNLSLENWHWI